MTTEKLQISAPVRELQASMLLDAPPGLAPPGVYTACGGIDSQASAWMPWKVGVMDSLDHRDFCWDDKSGLVNESMTANAPGPYDVMWLSQFSACQDAHFAYPVQPWNGRRSVDASDASSDTESTTNTSSEALLDLDVLTARLYGSLDHQEQALECIARNAPSLSKTQQGSRILQTALELAQGSLLEAIVDQFRGAVLTTSRSPHGNHVLLKCLDIIGPRRSQFIVDEITGKAVVVARHRFGSRVMQQLIKSLPQEQVSGLFDELTDELMTDGQRLVKHPFANFVVQKMLAFGTPAQRLQIGLILKQDAAVYNKHSVAKHVMRLASELDCFVDSWP